MLWVKGVGGTPRQYHLLNQSLWYPTKLPETTPGTNLSGLKLTPFAVRTQGQISKYTFQLAICEISLAKNILRIKENRVMKS